MGIFNETAPKFWALGIPVMPLHQRDKAPILKKWQSLSERMPTPEEQAYWLNNYQDCNIGLPLGPQSGCVALDIDTENQDLINLILNNVPTSPWVRIGRKGMVLMFKFSGQKTFRIKTVEGETICELLSSRTQVVLPPSIHPITQKPYTANCDLTTVIKDLPYLNPDIEDILRSAFMHYGVTLSTSGFTRTTDYVSQGSRDIKMTSMAGFFANGIIRGELSVKEAIDRMYAWYSSCVEKIAGDEVDIEKGIKNMLSFLVQDVTGPKNKVLPKGWDDNLTEEEKESYGLIFDDDMEEWDYSRLKNYLFEQFNLYAEDSPQRAVVVEYILKKMVYSPNLTSLEEDRLLRYISLNCKTMRIPALKNRLKELKSGELRGIDHTEIAKAVINELTKISLVCYHRDNLWKWNGSHWEILSEQEILCYIANNYGSLPAATRANDHRGIMKIIQTLVPQGLPESSIKGVNFANGYLTTEGTLLPHDPRFGMTYTLPYRYLPEYSQNLSKAMRFNSFLYSCWGEEPDYEERVQALREAIAVTLFGLGPTFTRAILLYGLANTGKSQLLKIIEKMLPPEAISYVPPYDFDDKFKVTLLSESIMNVCGELKENSKIPGASFKQIVDGSTLTGQYKNRPIFNFTPKATHWYASNYMPKSDDTTEGFNRRWLILSFRKIVKKEERILNLGDLIASEEREYIVSWAVGAIRDIIKNREYNLPRSHYQQIREMISENDSLFFYLVSEKGPRKFKDINDKRGTLHVDKLYESYASFCYSQKSSRPIGVRRYYQRLQELSYFMGFKVDNMIIKGITLSNDPSVIEDSIPLEKML